MIGLGRRYVVAEQQRVVGGWREDVRAVVYHFLKFLKS